MSVNDIRDFIFENYYKRIGCSKKSSYYSMKEKLMEKVTDPRNAKERYQLYLRKRNRKSVKQSETITSQPKTFALLI